MTSGIENYPYLSAKLFKQNLSISILKAILSDIRLDVGLVVKSHAKRLKITSNNFKSCREEGEGRESMN